MGWDGIDCGHWCHHRSKNYSMDRHLPYSALQLREKGNETTFLHDPKSQKLSLSHFRFNQMKSSKIKQPVPWIHRSCWVQDSSSVYLLFSRRDGEKSWKLGLRDAKQIQPMWLCIVSGKSFEDTFENTRWWKVEQMQPVWLCIHSSRPFENTFENTHWRKVKQM